ncbi:FecR family protein [Fulvivirga ligni]|uniref:FecR family protein n=1 Tax=Fulvivirga ligni TaxID=2904246 RepID=UPI001F23C43D|nr:FecR family protein [Fulvivirga ligni]UII24172.1 FecR domain-containing protein [Fulvivirga ligni]
MSYKDFTTEEFIHDERFRKWVLNTDPETNFFWEKWLLQNPEKSETIKEAKLILQNIRFSEAPFTTEQENQLWNRISNEIDSTKPQQKVLPLQEDVATKKRPTTLLKVASVIVLLVISGSAIYFNLNDEPTPASTIQFITKQNPKGQKSKVILPDGTVVNLNSESSIAYNKDFGKTFREVELAGEAFFEVAHDKSRPFTVRSGKISTTALGTAFNVRSYEDVPTQVTLINGSVEVVNNTNASKILLEPGFQVELKSDNHFEKSKFNEPEAILWKDGILYFKDTDFKKVIHTLERWYDVDIQVENMPDRELICSGRFKNEYLSNVLHSIGFSLDFTYTIDNNVVNIHFNP